MTGSRDGVVRSIASAAKESPLWMLQQAAETWLARTGRDPDFLVCKGDALRELRLELRMALKSEMPSIDDMRKVAARGELVIGGFRTYIGVDYGAGVTVRRVVEPVAAANDPDPENPGGTPVDQRTGD